MSGRLILVLTVCCGVVSCASIDGGRLPNTGVVKADGGGANGYQHGPDRSRFDAGGSAKAVVEFGYVKQVGTSGTFAMRLANGSVLALPNAARVAAAASDPYRLSAKEHEDLVTAYFTGNGLPREQIARVRSATLLASSGRADETRAASPRIIGFYAVLERSVDGVAVPDSYAWARFDSAGRVLEEGVYWPAIGQQVLNDAQRLKDRFADQEQRAQWQLRFSPDAVRVNLAIRHTAASSDDRFQAFASIDATYRKAAPALRTENALAPKHGELSDPGVTFVLHFDERGVARPLPQEVSRGFIDSPRM